jgi:quinol monooxygenase YgiN
MLCAKHTCAEEEAMSVRLVISISAAPGKGNELFKAMQARCVTSRGDGGCLQFEVFQSADDPDRLALLELWESQAALDAHAKPQAQRPGLPDGLRLGAGDREDYTYNRTR